jgi:predicted dehydrogenase
MAKDRLGVGFIGSGFNAQFHLQAWSGVRDADVLGVWSPNQANAAQAAELARRLDLGAARPYPSITAMVADPAIDALWLCGANYTRVENMEEIADAVIRAKGKLIGVACEKPLARNVAEARRMVELAAHTGLKHAYLENQVFAPHLVRGKSLLWARGAALTGRPYLARAAEEHAGPHKPWFWRGELQGGGVLNDMMCHSALVVRYLLTRPGESLASVRPQRVTAHIASLKWTRPEYAKRLAASMGKEVDYAASPAEDFASLTVQFETEDGHTAVGEATTSWSYVGAGLRLSAELLGPEYSLSWDSLDSGLKLFFSRDVTGSAGEDLVEKQNAEVGLMPVVPNEAVAYGYEAEDRHVVRTFLGREEPLLTWEDGLDVVRILMTAYHSAEQGRTIAFPPAGLDDFVPAVARGAWQPRA